MMADSSSNQARTGSRAVERAVAVLACFDDGAADLPISSLAARAGLPVSSAYRIVQALVRGGLLERVRDGYRIGPGLISLAVPSLIRSGVDIWAPQLYALAAGINITTSLAVVRAGQVFTILSARPPQKFCDVQLPPAKGPAEGSAAGQVLLAFSPSTSPVLAQRAEWELIRRRGFATSPLASNTSVFSLAVPVFDGKGLPWGAIGVQAGRRRLTEATVRQILPAMRHASARISQGPQPSPIRAT